MYKLVKTEHLVVAVGPSGCGKSTAIRRVAVELQRQSKFSIVPANGAEDIVNFHNPELQQVFVIDDLCGKATIDTNKDKKWYELLTVINDILNTKKVRILASCRIHIFQDRLLQHIELLRKATCDFLSDDFSLTNEEKRKIANSYLRKEETDQLFSNISSFECFPLLCYLYSRNRTGKIIEFFENPNQVIKCELKLLLKAANRKTYGTLLLFTVYNNCLSTSLLKRKSGIIIKPILKTISDTLDLHSNFSIEVVKSELENLQNFHVKKHTDAYSIIHDKMFDILVGILSEHDFNLTIELAHTDVIRDRFILKSLSEKNNYDSHVIVIPEEKEEKYLCRLSKDIKEGFLEKVFVNQNLACATFRQKLVKQIKDMSNFNELLHNVLSENIYFLVLFMLHKGYFDMVPLLITGHVDLNKVHNIGETPLFIAVNEGHSEIVDIFLKQNVNPNIPSWFTSRPIHESLSDVYNSVENLVLTFKKQFLSLNHRMSCTPTREDIEKLFEKHNTTYKKFRKTPLYIASLNGFAIIVEMLLKHRADPNIENDYNNVTPLYKACEKGFTEIVTLLLKFNACPNFFERFITTPPLYIELEAGHNYFVKLILAFNGELDTRSNGYDNRRDRKIPIHIASEKGYAHIVTLLLQSKADPNIRHKFDETALYIASARHHTDVVKLLLENGAYTETICSVDNNSPISVASQNGYADIVTLLLKFKADPNIRDKFNRTALYLASAQHHTGVVQILLHYRACPDIVCSIDNNSPISIASKNGHCDIVKLLKKHGPYHSF